MRGSLPATLPGKLGRCLSVAATVVTAMLVAAAAASAAAPRAISVDINLAKGGTTRIGVGALAIDLTRSSSRWTVSTSKGSYPLGLWGRTLNPDSVHVETTSGTKGLIQVNTWKSPVDGELWYSQGTSHGPEFTTAITPRDMVAHRLLELDYRLPTGTCLVGADSANVLHTSPGGGNWGCGFMASAMWEAAARYPGYPWGQAAARRTLEIAGMNNPLNHDLGYINRPLVKYLAANCANSRNTPACNSVRAAARKPAESLVRLAAYKAGGMLPVGLGFPGGGNRAIVDSLGNLGLIRWYAGEFRDSTAAATATRAALAVGTTLLRSNNGIWQAAEFDAAGTLMQLRTIQGRQPDGVWSRGQSWAVMGFTQASGFATGQSATRLRRWAEDTGDFLFSKRRPDGLVSWDLTAANSDLPDASAVAISADGMAQLSVICKSASCNRSEATWKARACSLLNAWLSTASMQPPFGLTLGQVGYKALGGWMNNAEYPFTLDYGMEAINRVTTCP